MGNCLDGRVEREAFNSSGVSCSGMRCVELVLSVLGRATVKSAEEPLTLSRLSMKSCLIYSLRNTGCLMQHFRD